MKRITIILLLVLSLFLVGCGDEPTSLEVTLEKDGSFVYTSYDGWEMHGKRLDAQGTPRASVVLSHMLGSQMDVYNKLAKRLSDEGFEVIYYDLRGHGKSTMLNGNKVEHPSFTTDMHKKHEVDISDMIKLASHEPVYAVGASITANSLFRYAAQNDEVKKVVLLSAANEYYGINARNQLYNFGSRPALIMASQSDTKAYKESKGLFRELTNAQFEQFSGTNHGTQILDSNPEAIDKIVDFFKE